MMRNVAIFAAFAFATVLVIVLQPGPRPDYAFDSTAPVMQDTTRNEVSVLHTPQAAPVLEIPDDVVLDLKKRAKDAPDQQASQKTGSLQRLQAALDASLGTVSDTSSLVENATPQSRIDPVAVQVDVPASVAIAPELRDMSWQTLNTLNALGERQSSPGQEGSLLNSIVRHSMGYVEDAPAWPGAQPAVLVRSEQPDVDVWSSAQMATYQVVPGDTLALIAIKLYGSALAKDRLLADNPVLRSNPDALRIGQALRYSAN